MLAPAAGHIRAAAPRLSRVVDERLAFVDEAEPVPGDGVDPAACGGAVTAALRGHREHDSPCRWPHKNDVDTTLSPLRHRTVFVSTAADEPEVLAPIDEALAGADGWSFARSVPRRVAPEERELAGRLLSGPYAS